jgi:molecular chaperone IbpA
MRTFDFSPLYKSAVGFDRLAHILDAVSRVEDGQSAYPPYNIEATGDNQYRISMAIAGFDKAEVEIEVELGVLKVSGKKQESNAQRQFLYRGIAARNFTRKFQLADNVLVTGASMENGLLHIELVREIPAAAKPRKIAIQSHSETQPQSGESSSAQEASQAA